MNNQNILYSSHVTNKHLKSLNDMLNDKTNIKILITITVYTDNIIYTFNENNPIDIIKLMKIYDKIEIHATQQLLLKIAKLDDDSYNIAIMQLTSKIDCFDQLREIL